MSEAPLDVKRLTAELGYYKNQLDQLAGENLRLDYTISGLRHELQQKRQGFALLSALQQSIGAHKEISSIFDITIRAINSTLGMDKTVILSPTGKRNVYRPSHWLGLREEGSTALTSLDIEFRESFSDGSGLIVANRSSDATDLIVRLRETFELPFFICLPVMAEQVPIGLLLSGRMKEARPLYPPLDQGDVDTFQAIAGLISASVQHMRIAVLTEMDRLKTEFFANISHEFRTPITLTLGPLQQILADRHGPVPPSIRSQLNMMLRNQERLLGLINQILDLAKFEGGGMQLRAAPVADINHFIEERVRQFHAIAERRKLDLTLSLDPRLRSANLYLDTEKFDRVISNLLSNAVKFTKAGTIEVTTTLQDGAFRVTVSDTGVGIKADELPHIFDRFRQADGSVSREYSGTGIGLALVKEIAALHGGAVSVRSQYGEGSSFEVAIPLGNTHLSPASIIEFRDEEVAPLASARAVVVEEDTADHESVEESNRQTLASFDPDRSTILYVDDN